MRYYALALVVILCTSTAFAEDEEGLFTISSTAYNIHPQVAYSPVSSSFLVVWLYTDDILTYKSTQVRAAQLHALHQLTLQKTFRISRASRKKIQAPGTAVTYHPAMSRFLVVWQEINGEDRTLFLTTVDDFGIFDDRTSILARQKATLLSPPLIAVDPVSGRAMAAWTKLEDGKVKTVATSFDPNDPNHLSDPRITFESDEGRYEIGQVLVYAGDTFRLVNCLVNPNRERCIAITGRDINPMIDTVSNSAVLTRKRIRRSMALSAVQADDPAQTLVSYDQTGFQFENSVLAFMIIGDAGNTVAGPTRLTEPNGLSGESRMLSSASDGFARILWLERHENQFILKLDAVTEEGDFIGEPISVRTTSRPIGNAAIAYGQYSAGILVVWSEDNPAGGVDLLCRLIDLQ
jgi:hypothetical protein